MSKCELFTDLLRKTTREIHNINDLLVTAKFAYTISNEAVLAEGLSVFYEIFKYLENATLHSDDIAKFDLPELKLTERFETDLKHYFGDSWKDNLHPPNESVQKYLHHLRTSEVDDARLLVVYVYHLYLGLFSGGQLIRKRVTSSFIPSFMVGSKKKAYTCAIFEFDKHLIARVKKNIKDGMNAIAENVDDETRQKWLDESKVLFTLNIDLIKSVKSSKQVAMRRCLNILTCTILVTFLILLFYYFRVFKNAV